MRSRQALCAAWSLQRLWLRVFGRATPAECGVSSSRLPGAGGTDAAGVDGKEDLLDVIEEVRLLSAELEALKL